MERFDTISPLDFRYYTGTVFDKLQPFLSESAAIRYQLDVEIALVETLAEFGICDKKVAEEVKHASENVTAAAVYEEEARIRHNIRALVNILREQVSDAAKPYVHFTATSNDIISTSEAARLKDVVEQVILPTLLELEKTLITLALKEKATVQIGRTHGQHAEPITFGHTIASYVARLGRRIEKIQEAASEMRGKFSGPVGAYNASSLFIKRPEEFEKKVLEKVGLRAASHSTQIVEAEYTTDLHHTLISAFGVMANIADDMRHLQRSEINEVAEQFGSEQVGSSTMPHKRNPINFENVKSLWKAFMPRMMTVYMDQISEHQRDLTNSASSRFTLEIAAATFIAANRLSSAMSKIVVDEAGIKKNFEKSKDMIAAEPSYILLASFGHPDAHEAVRKLTLEAQKSKKSFSDLLFANEELQPYLKKLKKEQRLVLQEPERYIGIAVEKTEKVCREWEEKLKLK